MSDGLLESVLARLQVVKGPDARGEYTAWCPYHPDGEGKPPHQPNLKIHPERGFICHACKESGGLRKLAGHLNIPVSIDGEGWWETHNYADESGKLLFQVVRRPGKRFAQRRPDGKGGWIWNRRGVRTIPYRLPDLLNHPDALVFIVEGEKDADRLARLGLLATTNAGGAGKWKEDHAKYLVGRDVVILPDNDDAGRKHGEQIARTLSGVARSIKRITLPGLPEKGDVSDWLDAGHSVDELRQLVEETAISSTDDGKGQGIGNRVESQAKALAESLLKSEIELFHDERGEPYARLQVNHGPQIVPIGSRMFERYLSRIAWEEMGKSPSRDALSAAARTLSSIACFDGDKHPLALRHAWRGKELWIDLDGHSAVRVWPGHWDIVQDPPILFRSFPHQRPLPTPVRGGDPWRLFEFVNLCDDDAKKLLKGFLVGALLPDTPVPALAVHGVQGSAKSSLFRALKRILDPTAVEVRGGVKDATELAQALFQNRVLFFDNLTSLPAWMSDALCGAITGDGWSKRALYTDEDSIYFEYQRVVGMSGINLVARRADLLDRSLILELKPIPRDQRRDEESLWREFDQAAPGIFGGLLDRVAAAMEIRATQDLSNLPRMADFCRWGAAASVADGKEASDFVHVYQRNIERQTDAAIESSPVAEAVLAWFSNREEWTGTAGELHKRLTETAEKLHIDTRGRSWPKAANWLSHRLKEVQPPLEARGIRITFGRDGDARTITVCEVPGKRAAATTSASSDDGTGDGEYRHTVTNCVTQNGPENGLEGPHDGSDGNDGISATFEVRQETDETLAGLDEDFEERAAICEYDGGMSRKEAEKTANG